MADSDKTALHASNVDLLFLGGLQSDYGILPDQRTFEQMPGGAALYALVGAMIWIQTGLGLVSRISRRYPAQWSEYLTHRGIRPEGRIPIAGDMPMTAFHCFRSWEERMAIVPVQAYGRLGVPCPSELTGISSASSVLEDAEIDSDLVPRPDDIPGALRQARYAYLAPLPSGAQIRLTNTLRQSGTGNIFVSIPPGEMSPEHVGRIRLLLQGMQICYCTEDSALRLFDRPYGDIRDLAERLSSFGPQIILLGRKQNGFAIFDSLSRKHLLLPAYASTIRNPIGLGHAFCGGFLAGWNSSYQLLEAGLRGSVSASLAADGLGAFHALECNPLLAEMRLEAMRRLVQ